MATPDFPMESILQLALDQVGQSLVDKIKKTVRHSGGDHSAIQENVQAHNQWCQNIIDRDPDAYANGKSFAHVAGSDGKGLHKVDEKVSVKCGYVGSWATLASVDPRKNPHGEVAGNPKVMFSKLTCAILLGLAAVLIDITPVMESGSVNYTRPSRQLYNLFAQLSYSLIGSLHSQLPFWFCAAPQIQEEMHQIFIPLSTHHHVLQVRLIS
jgi:hypothetical protein